MSISRTADDEPEWDRLIGPQRHALALNLTEVWDYRDLLWLLVNRDVVTHYKQTILGPLWYFVQPILTMAMYVMVFGFIAKLSTDGISAPLFYMAGVVMWAYFADCFHRTSGTFVGNAHLFGKVYFPRLVVPLAVVISGLIKFAIQLAVFLVMYLVWAISEATIPLNAWALTVPFLIGLMAAISLGFGILFSALTNKYRDLRFVIEFGIQLWMYATPIIYPLSAASPRMRAVLWWNPLTHLVEAFRYGFFGTGTVSTSGIAYTSVFALAIVMVGIIVFNRTEQTFMDTV